MAGIRFEVLGVEARGGGDGGVVSGWGLLGFFPLSEVVLLALWVAHASSPAATRTAHLTCSMPRSFPSIRF